uniref:U3 small nucleolar RNA-associated protein 6 homolog n=1 Tax=Photinus pyralis TaxID=7054 RepID=A0A1Y1JV88_PHOPY
MADFTQKRLDSIMEEVEDMRRTKLFTPDETRVVFKKRKEFEQKIHSVLIDVKSYEEYIIYEKSLLKDIGLRRKKHKIFEKNNIEYKIIKRIKTLYELALQRTNDVSLILAFFKFCKRVNYVHDASDAIARLVQLHADDPKVWQAATNWHAYDRKDINAALAMFPKALEIHKDSQMLYKERITLEIHSMVHNIKSKDECITSIREVVDTIFTNINDPNFYIELIVQLEEHQFTLAIQDVIINKMTGDYYNNENIWHALAQRERRGIYQLIKLSNPEPATKSRTPKAKLEACFAKYLEGLSKVSQVTKPKLWALYLDFLIDLQQDTASANVLKQSTLKAALHSAYSEDCLLERHYIAWVTFAQDEDALEIAEKGTDAFPHSVELWELRLCKQILKGDTGKVNLVFKLSIINLKEKSLPLWQKIISYHLIMSHDDYIHLIYRDAVKQAKEISDDLKPKYIEWLALAKGMKVTRDVYNELAIQEPYCKDLHAMMSKMESVQLKYNFKAWEKVHERACEQFGAEDVDVWIDYIVFYTDYYKVHENPAERIQWIHSEAEKKLHKSLILDFNRKYAKITNG